MLIMRSVILYERNLSSFRSFKMGELCESPFRFKKNLIKDIVETFIYHKQEFLTFCDKT